MGEGIRKERRARTKPDSIATQIYLSNGYRLTLEYKLLQFKASLPEGVSHESVNKAIDLSEAIEYRKHYQYRN
jgi:hypothetical protein